MSVSEYALTSVDEVLSYLGKDPHRNALWVYCSQGDATAATVEVTDTTIVLTITGGAEAGADTLTLADADKNTLSELVTAINALTGWTAGRIYHADASSGDLLVTGALSCLGSANEITLETKDIYLIEKTIDRATGFIERYCDRKFVTRSYTQESYYGNGSNKLLIDQYPVTRVVRLRSGRSTSFSIKNTSTDANFCTVEITATTIRLVVNGGANVDDSALTLADYTTIDALIAAIVALSKGWSCTTLATDTSTRDASELLIRPSMNVTPVVQAECETADVEYTDYQVISPTESRNYGVIVRPGVFFPGTEYFIDYTAGYTAIPAELEQACIELVKYKFDQSTRDRGLKSEKLGGVYEYVMADLKDGLPYDLLMELNLFRRVEV